jgi:acetyl-CoA carboxylase biotin carboxyl carrier protein
MAGAPSKEDFFDVRKIRRLVELMKEYELSEIDLQQGDTRIQLRRGGETVAVVPGVRPAYALPEPAPQPAEAPGAAAPPPVEAKPEEEHIVVIRSPMVGTFYAAPDPDSPSYVNVGDPVGPETVVCIVEAMKVFNQIPAEVSGKIVAVLVENGEPVEYGQPMFKVDTRQ